MIDQEASLIRLTSKEAYHTPVMVNEALQGLEVKPGGLYIDCTVGDGGHAEAILGFRDASCSLLGLDLDDSAIRASSERLERYGSRAILIRTSYVEAWDAATVHGFVPCDGVLMDLGLSSRQLDGAERGFTFREDQPLDMRFDQGQKFSAADVVNEYSERHLADVIFSYGEERSARRIATAIVKERPISSSLALAQLLSRVMGGRRGKIHPATKTFQALRIEVNNELENVKQGLNNVIKLLGPRGRLAVIAYHSLEDRIVKTFLKRAAAACVCPPGIPSCVCGQTQELRLISKKPITASIEEVQKNPRSRSARLRVAEHV